jgi:hypothetical protein
MNSSGVFALEIQSTAAGFAAIPTTNCETDANNFEIEVIINSPVSCLRHGIAEFNVSSSGLTSVSSAIVTLFDGVAANTEGSFFTVDLYGYEGDGQVTGSDYGFGTYFGSAIWSRYGMPTGEFAIDVTDYVNSQLALGVGIIGLSIRTPLQTSNCCSTTFLYFDGANGDHPPSLSLQPVPLPAGAWLFGSALALLAWCRRGGLLQTES